MSKKKKITLLFFPIIIIIALFAVRFWAQEPECTETNENFDESFNTTEYKDPESSVDHWGEGYVSLNRIGANFNITNPNSMPIWINSVAANDFDGDGWPDIVGSSSSFSNVLAFVRNMGAEGDIGSFVITKWIDGSEGSDGWPAAGVNGQPIDGSGHCGLTSGDYDGDGDYDFLFIASQTGSPYSFKRIWLYENHLVDQGLFYFTQTDLTSAWSSEIKGIAWSSTMIVSIDFDSDDDTDILTGNKDGEVLLLRNTASGEINENTFFVESTPVLETGWEGRGLSTLSIADLDVDGDLDIFVGSVSYPELRYYKNNGSDFFSQYATYEDLDGGTNDHEFDGAATVSIVSDFDMDGDEDFMIGTDNWNYKPGGEEIGGMCFYFRNSGGELDSRLIFDNRPTVYDFDLGAVYDYDQDGDTDFLIADGNHSEMYYLFINGLADVYNLQGIALSTNLTSQLDPNTQAITKVRIKNLEQRVMGGSGEGLVIEYYVSSNGGINWELYTRYEGAELQNYSDLPWHTFNHYGTQFRWKAILYAEEDEMEEYIGASFETPVIDRIKFEYIYVDRREYSRTSVAATVMDENEQEKKLILGGTFYFPGWQGHLRAYDVSAMTAEESAYSALRTVTRPDLSSPSGREIVASGVEIFWDAGELLNSRSPSDRAIYTALPGDPGFTRTDFTLANADLLAPILQDVNGDNTGLINFVRGEDRDWKLGDINHSNPIVVGPPDEASAQMGDGYDVFKEAWEDRTKVVYVGANDGLLHCFNLLTGEELWGFIPYNLLSKLNNMWGSDPNTEMRYFARDVYVDGSFVVADVYIDPDDDGLNEWKTVLVCGQGPGKGSTVDGEINCYFALDITDPTDPQPLWEFTHDRMGETWSVPSIGKIVKDGEVKWAAFTGSGFDNNDEKEVGNRFYAVDLDSGESFWVFNTGEVNTEEIFGLNIKNAIPGSSSIIDTDQDGYADCVYFGDLDGRIWKIDVSIEFINKNSWSCEAIYEDSSNYPIICKPAVWINPYSGGTIPHLFFGTGGDDKAPNDTTYSFVALLDSEIPEVEWYLGIADILNLPEEKDAGDLEVGEKVWADPKVANSIVYFSTLMGSIESVDPCENIAGIGKLYARFIQSVAGASMGGTAFKTPSGPAESLEIAIKTRAAITLGERVRAQGGTRKREVYIQEYDSTIQRLEQPVGSLLIVRSWREIYRAIR